MFSIIQTVLLIFIAWFLVTNREGQVSFGRNRGRKIIMDSCALIDGRIVEIVGSGFLADEIIVPQFILNELQMLADGSDSHKRERARFGLDIAHQLQDSSPVKVTVDRTVLQNAPDAVDDRLVALAKKLKACLYTTDFNLGKVAAVEGVKVLNVNGLAGSLRPITLPGETLMIKVIQKGSNRDQGVGYLDDGTMIVVDGAARFIGKTMPVTVTRMHQTVAGKMVFGQVKEAAVHAAKQADKQPGQQDAAKQESAQRSSAAKPAGSAGSHQPQRRLQNRLRGMVRRPNRTISS